MKLFIGLCLMAMAAAQTYSPENDNLDIEAVVNNDDTLKAFYGCFMETGSCDAVQADFKKDLPEAVEQACAKCTSAQKHILKRFLEALKQKFPQEYEEFRKKFDPETKYFTKLETAVANS
ncbi:ejaculatory bulb-specific protein 3-like isoform X2 [Pectinophora gossypiella]|uniref:Uncharacterized protein n=2 Tax=Pectinophora gossypiella TaxID=13191 RepID=A0A1E1WJG8_PECGO|nr:ejaculatory bulb-specific protein 3-like isoform X2 [Pectinophora gossypiella]XP_049877096.1 ejaculatory bulb-specific protein 3-like isoform X2 [Pectinophora gossypiella]XP_049877098.1 ejaculatory bulb-specific protein 3-like isoform X2 [Pectinophora gossypiella]